MPWNGGQLSQYCPHCGRPTSKRIIFQGGGQKKVVDNRKKTCLKCDETGCNRCMHLRKSESGDLITDQWFHKDCFSSGINEKALADVKKAFRGRFVFVNGKDEINLDNLRKVVRVIFCAVRALSHGKIRWAEEIHNGKSVKYTVFFVRHGKREEKLCWWIRDLVRLVRGKEYTPTEFLCWLIEEYEANQEKDDLDSTSCGKVQTGY